MADTERGLDRGSVRDLMTVRLRQNTYAAALARCSNVGDAGCVVPANRKSYRNWAASQLLIEAMEDVKLTYPNPHLDERVLTKTLQAVA